MAWMSISRPNISASASRVRVSGLVAAALLALSAVPTAVSAQAAAAEEHAPQLLARFHGDWQGTVMFRNVLNG